MRDGALAIRWLLPVGKTALLWFARTFGTRLLDPRTGESIGRVLIVPWKGKLAIFGLTKDVRPEFVPQTRVTYAKQDLAFLVVPEPNYPNVRGQHDSSYSPKS